MTTASVTLTQEQMALITVLPRSMTISGTVHTIHLSPKLAADLHELGDLLRVFDGPVTVTGPIHVSGVEAEKVTVRNSAEKRDRETITEHDDLTRLTMAAARVIGDRRDLIALDAMAGTSGKVRDRAVAHLERSLNDLTDALSVVINHQEGRNA
jgi:hypothetical protein